MQAVHDRGEIERGRWMGRGREGGRGASRSVMQCGACGYARYEMGGMMESDARQGGRGREICDGR